MAKRTGEKYKVIIEAAINVIGENGYQRSQVSKIAREAGVAEGTIYLYFENKEDILISIFREKLGEFISTASEKLNSIANPFEMLANLIYLHFSSFQNNRRLARVLQIELRQSDLSIRKGISEVVSRYYRLIEGIVQEGIDRDCFRPEIDPGTARKIIFGSIDEVVTCWVLSGRGYSLIDMSGQVYQFLARAMAGGGRYDPFPPYLKPAGHV